MENMRTEINFRLGKPFIFVELISSKLSRLSASKLLRYLCSQFGKKLTGKIGEHVSRFLGTIS